MYSERKIMQIVTKNDKITIIEGNTVVTYTVTDVPEQKMAAVEEAAMSFVQFLIDSSAFASGEYTENNGKPVEY
jgi:hypothetical protein